MLRAKVKVFVDLYLLAEQASRQAQERLVLAEERAARAAAERATLRLDFLARASAALAATLDFDATAQALLELLVPELADVGVLTLTAATGERARSDIVWCVARAPTRTSSASASSELESPMLARRTGPRHRKRPRRTDRKPRHGARRFRSRAAGAGRRSIRRSWFRSPRAGACSACSRVACTAGREFDVDALSVATDVANRAAIALDNALLYRNIQDDARRKNEFLAMLAHELRNPMAPIGNAVHVLNTAGESSERVAWSRDVIGRQLKQLVRLVDDLLDVSRITRGAIDLKIASIDVAEVVSAAVETSRPLVDENAHTLTVVVPKEPLRVKGDFARVAQALANLINNAAKYTNRGGRICVSVASDGDEVAFRVRDSGIGIPTEFISRIFEPFTQIDRSLDRTHGGLGIGLTLVRRLTEMQGGTVTASSDGKDKGSEFVIRLPLAPATVESRPAASTDDDEALDGMRVRDRRRQPRRRREHGAACCACRIATCRSRSTATAASIW